MTVYKLENKPTLTLLNKPRIIYKNNYNGDVGFLLTYMINTPNDLHNLLRDLDSGKQDTMCRFVINPNGQLIVGSASASHNHCDLSPLAITGGFFAKIPLGQKTGMLNKSFCIDNQDFTHAPKGLESLLPVALYLRALGTENCFYFVDVNAKNEVNQLNFLLDLVFKLPVAHARELYKNGFGDYPEILLPRSMIFKLAQITRPEHAVQIAKEELATRRTSFLSRSESHLVLSPDEWHVKLRTLPAGKSRLFKEANKKTICGLQESPQATLFSKL